MDNLNAFVTDPKLRQPINETLDNTAKITDTGTRIAANTEVISKNGIIMSHKAIEIEDKAKGLEDDAKGVLNHLNSVFGPHHVSPLLGGLPRRSIRSVRTTRATPERMSTSAFPSARARTLTSVFTMPSRATNSILSWAISSVPEATSCMVFTPVNRGLG